MIGLVVGFVLCQRHVADIDPIRIPESGALESHHPGEPRRVEGRGETVQPVRGLGGPQAAAEARVVRREPRSRRITIAVRACGNGAHDGVLHPDLDHPQPQGLAQAHAEVADPGPPVVLLVLGNEVLRLEHPQEHREFVARQVLEPDRARENTARPQPAIDVHANDIGSLQPVLVEQRGRR